MLKLLIAVENEELRSAMAQTMAADYLVESCCDGQQAMALLEEFQPDLWLLDLMLPMVDGITLLHYAEKTDRHPITLAILPFETPYIMGELCKSEVAYVVKKPCCVDALAVQLQALAATVPAPSHCTAHPSVGVSSILLELGLSPKVDGFGYLTAAIPMLIADSRQSLTKELYTAVGHSCSKSGMQVERCIRTAIHSAWKKSDLHIWQRYFPAAPDGSVPRPSNGDFIARIAAFLSQKNAQRGA